MSDTKSPSQLYTQPENIKNGILIMTSLIAVPVDKRYSHDIMLLIYIFLMFSKTIKSNYKGTQVWEACAVCNKMPGIRLTGFAWASISNIYWSSRILTKVWRHFFLLFYIRFPFDSVTEELSRDETIDERGKNSFTAMSFYLSPRFLDNKCKIKFSKIFIVVAHSTKDPVKVT